MLNNINKDFYDKYYNIDIFHESNNIFESYLDTCSTNVNKTEMSFTEFNISTITTIIDISNYINIKVLYEQLEISDDIIYLEYNNKIKGIRRKKKIKKTQNNTDKRKEKKGKCFSNQLSIGFGCKEHIHNNPICMKVFSKGSLTLTGVKSNEEIKKIINKFLKLLNNINKNYYFNDKLIKLIPYGVLNEDILNNYKIETTNGTFKCNFNINLEKLKKIISSKYKTNEIFLKSNKPGLLQIDLLNHKIYDERKNKYKNPKVFLYGTGSIVINSITEELLFISYKFIKKFITDNYNDIIDIDYEFNL